MNHIQKLIENYKTHNDRIKIMKPPTTYTTNRRHDIKNVLMCLLRIEPRVSNYQLSQQLQVSRVRSKII